jgi:hypothetical protein
MLMSERMSNKNKSKNRYRGVLLGGWYQVESVVRKIRVFSWTFFVILGLGLLASSQAGEASLWSLSRTERPAVFNRQISSLAFPQVRQTSDTDDILSTYPAYLKFVLEVGGETDAATARKLADTYTVLRKRYPVSAARFLKGLRFEMVEKMELMGTNTATVSTRTPEVRRWVSRFMKEWLREADEYHFRSVTMQKGIAKE